MAKSPLKQTKPDNKFVTAKIKIGVYNQLVSLRQEKESLSSVIERYLNPKKGVKRTSVKLA